MSEFGLYLKGLRRVNVEDLRVAARANRRKRLETAERSICEDYVEQVPNSFRARQQLARRLGMNVKSLRDVASAMGISKNTLHEYEAGKRYPSAEFVFDFCAAVETAADPVIRKWVRCHPNPNVRRHQRFGHFNRELTNSRDDPLGYEKRKSINFIVDAILFAVPLAGVESISAKDAGRIASTAAMLMNRALSEGKGPNPDLIRYVIEKYYDPDDHLSGLGFPTI